jgi:hypothetical protein
MNCLLQPLFKYSSATHGHISMLNKWRILRKWVRVRRKGDCLSNHLRWCFEVYHSISSAKFGAVMRISLPIAVCQSLMLGLSMYHCPHILISLIL